MKPPDPAVALPNIRKSQDERWLAAFRANMARGGVAEIVEAIDARLAELRAARLETEIGSARSDLALAERVEEAVRVLEVFLAIKHQGKRVKANRTRRTIGQLGAKEAVRRTVMSHTMSSGLSELAAHGRLDCAFEQIILDFPAEFDGAAISKARKNLKRLQRGG